MENYSELHGVCIQVFEAVSKTTSIFILPLFMVRIVFANLAGEGNKAFQAIKGVLIYFTLLAAFPMIIDILFSIPESYLPKYAGLASFSENSPDWNSSSIIPFAVDRILEVVLAGLYWIAYYLHIFFMIAMCSMAPVVFLSSTLLGFGMGLEIFLGLLVVGSSWPIIWYGFDQVHASLSTAQSDEFGSKCLELLLTLFKGITPVAFASLAVKSPAGQAVSKAAQVGISAGKWMAMKAIPAASIPAKILDRSKESRQRKFEDRQRAFFPGNGLSSQNGKDPKGKSDRLSKAKYYSNSFQKKGQVNENSRSRDIQA